MTEDEFIAKINHGSRYWAEEIEAIGGNPREALDLVLKIQAAALYFAARHCWSQFGDNGLVEWLDVRSQQVLTGELTDYQHAFPY